MARFLPIALVALMVSVGSPVTPATASTAPVELPTARPAVPRPMFAATVSPITAEVAGRMTHSWRPECPVPLEDLRYLTVSHVDFEGSVRTGEIVVNADVADTVVEIFRTLFAERFPIRQMRLVDEFDGDVLVSLAADNTSGFNCRRMLLGSAWSEHAYGRAIDVNPVENPYVLDDYVEPRDGVDFVERRPGPGVLIDGDAAVRAFTDAGWTWGGHWEAPWALDYMHFSPSGQ